MASSSKRMQPATAVRAASRQLTRAVALGLSGLAPAAQAFPAVIEAASLDGINGFSLTGRIRSVGVSGAGDFNGDGIDDVLVGVGETDSVYLVFGRAAPYPPTIPLDDVDGSNGFILRGPGGLGRAVSWAGDVNADGIDDIIIGVPPDYPRRTYGWSDVVFGGQGPFPRVFDVTTLDGSNGFKIVGVEENSLSVFGDSVSGAGDVNGDGIADLLIGAPGVEVRCEYGGDCVGASYVVFGRGDGFPASVQLSELDGSNGFKVQAYWYSQGLGISVSDAGDVNADGIDDLFLGSYDTGRHYVVFGAPSFPALLKVRDLDGSDGFAMYTGTSYRANARVSGAGDINGDGIDDVILGVPGYSPDHRYFSGESVVVFGSREPFPAVLELQELDGGNGFAMLGSGDQDLGTAVSGAGDVNDDGIDDFIVGERRGLDDQGHGQISKTYVVFGATHGFPVFDLSRLNGRNGFALNGKFYADRIGCAVSDAGDFNGDGVADIMVAAEDSDDVYVVFGCNRDVDVDCDYIPADADNCTLADNADQRDTDGDGIGNFCDADFDQDCEQSFTDLGIMKANFFLGGDLNTDLDGDGFTNFVDLGMLKGGFFEPPGPSGVPNLCDGSRKR